MNLYDVLDLISWNTRVTIDLHGGSGNSNILLFKGEKDEVYCTDMIQGEAYDWLPEVKPYLNNKVLLLTHSKKRNAGICILVEDL